MNKNNLGKVAVLMGGMSEEREISLVSGANVLAALQRNHINAVGIDVGKDVIEKLQAENVLNEARELISTLVELV